METTRFILTVALGLVLIMIWQAWQEDYGVTTSLVGTEKFDAAIPEKNENVDLPNISIENTKERDTAFAIQKNVNDVGELDEKTIHVKTDVLDLEIDTIGGTITRLSLLKYPVSKKQRDIPVHLLNNQPDNFYLIQGGLLSKSEFANHKTKFATEITSYELNGAESLSVPLVWQTETGLKVIKTFTFYRGKYLSEVSYQVINGTGKPWYGRAYAQINRTEASESGSRFIYTYTGAVISTPEKRYEKIKFNKIEEEDLSVDVKNGWVAMVQHYFFTALIPSSKEEKYHYYTLNPRGQSYVIGAITEGKTIESGDSGTFNQQFYFGPKLQKELNQIADGLELAVDYGILWFIAEPLYWMLNFIHIYTDNWGWAIVLVVLLLKILFYRLSATGYRSMANMRKVQPKLLSIKERYKNDKARLNQAMMALYKEEKINPLGGCFPILIQIPVFISLYWVLLETVELRQADFVLWIHDLSIPDPYFILPLLMGVTMFAQQKLNPAPMDPIQEKVMTALPVIFTGFFAFFPSGLVLYWVVNNILSIVQQWLITKSIDKKS